MLEGFETFTARSGLVPISFIILTYAFSSLTVNSFVIDDVAINLPPLINMVESFLLVVSRNTQLRCLIGVDGYPVP